MTQDQTSPSPPVTTNGVKGKPEYSTIEEAVEIARSLAPRFRERVARAEELRRLPEENVDDMLASGLIDLESPRRWGGPELSLDALLEVTAAIAQECPSTGWVYALWAAHMWLIGQYPEHVQEMVFGDPRPLVSSVVNTVGTPEQVDGGYRWTGRGFFSSGVDHSSWLTAAVDLKPNEPPGDRRWLLLRRSDFEIVDDWYTVGLKGTGSKTIVINDAFIPDDRVVRAKDLSEGVGEGAQLHKSPLYCAAMDFTFSLPLAGPELGIARAVIDSFAERCRTRLSSGNPRQAAEQAATLTRLARASADVDAARALLLEDARRFCNMPAAEASLLDRAKCRRDVAYATQLCRGASNSVFEAGGGSNVYDKADMQRLWRDANVAAAHHGLMWDVHGLAYGRIAVGLPGMEQPAL
jgi:alkylation response protein AidB-like acyl-CoA dehydrogenase